jgi:hypothetical protein
MGFSITMTAIGWGRQILIDEQLNRGLVEELSF